MSECLRRHGQKNPFLILFPHHHVRSSLARLTLVTCVRKQAHSRQHQLQVTSDVTLSLISWYSSWAEALFGSPPCKSAITRIPSSSLSVSINQLWRAVSDSHYLGRRLAYRGLSGMSKEPPARMPPITHCMKSGKRHDMSESMKEQA